MYIVIGISIEDHREVTIKIHDLDYFIQASSNTLFAAEYKYPINSNNIFNIAKSNIRWTSVNYHNEEELT